MSLRESNTNNNIIIGAACELGLEQMDNVGASTRLAEAGGAADSDCAGGTAAVTAAIE